MNLPINTNFQNTADKLVTPPYADALIDVLFFLKNQTRMIILGDTDHGESGLCLFHSSRPHMERLGEGGFDHVFLEQRARHQSHYITLQNGTVLPQEIEAPIFENAYISESLCTRINQQYKTTLYNLRQPIFHAADCRDIAEIARLAARSRKVSHSMGAENFAGKLLFNSYKMSLYDFDTAQTVLTEMRTAKGSSLVIYGDGHFCGYAENIDVLSMYHYLTKARLNPLRVSLHYSHTAQETFRANGKKAAGKHYRPADIDFIANGDKEPTIMINNPALVEPYQRYAATIAPSAPHAPKKDRGQRGRLTLV